MPPGPDEGDDGQGTTENVPPIEQIDFFENNFYDSA